MQLFDDNQDVNPYLMAGGSERCITDFRAALSDDGKAVMLHWKAALQDGEMLILKRGSSRGVDVAKVIGTYVFVGGKEYEITDTGFVSAGVEHPVYYLVAQWWSSFLRKWITFKTFGPVTPTVAVPVPVTPSAAKLFDAGLETGDGTSQRVFCSYQPQAADEKIAQSIRVYISGYRGVAEYVAIAQSAKRQFSFLLAQTGEAVTLKALIVNDGVEQTTAGLTKALTLNGNRTVPPKIVDAKATELATGAQIDFPACDMPSIDKYNVWRAAIGAGFGAASIIGFVNDTGESRYSYLDTGGLGGRYEWYVTAHNSIGDSAEGDKLTCLVQYTTADQPPNAPTNTTNYATVDSIDAGASATIRIYGPGGVGTSWNKPTGYDATGLSYPAGTITGKSYTTLYYIMWDGSQYLALTQYPQTLPDNYIWVGKVTTVAAGGGGGTSGGGGGGGGGGGCTEVGTILEMPEGKSSIILIECDEWVGVKLHGEKPLFMHPDTLVSVFKKAKELTLDDMIEVGDGDFEKAEALPLSTHKSYKQKINQKPSKTYKAGPRRMRLHNNKAP